MCHSNYLLIEFQAALSAYYFCFSYPMYNKLLKQKIASLVLFEVIRFAPVLYTCIPNVLPFGPNLSQPTGNKKFGIH